MMVLWDDGLWNSGPEAFTMLLSLVDVS